MAENPFLTSPFAPPAVARQPAETPAVDDQFVEAAPAKMQAPARRGMVPTKQDLVARAQQLGVDPALALSFFTQESSGNWNSKDSPKGARGGMQVMPGTYKAMMGTSAGQTDPWMNMEAGLRYIAYGQRTLGTKDPELLAAGYHAGYDRKDLKAGRIPGTNDGMISTADYARSVAARVRGSRQPASQPVTAKSTLDELNAGNPGLYSIEGDDPVLADLNKGTPGLYSVEGEGSGYAAPQAHDTRSGSVTENLADVGRLTKMGVNSAAQDVRELVGRIPLVGQGIVSGLDKVDEYFTGKTSDKLLADDTKSMQGALTPAMGEALQKKWWDEDKGTFGSAWSDPRAYLGGVVQSLPTQALTMVPAMRLAKYAYGAKVAAGASAQVASAAAARAATLAGGVGEGLLGGAQSSREVRDEVLALKPDVLAQSDAFKALITSGMKPEEAQATLANDAATRAFVTSGVTTGLFGGMGDRALAKIFVEKAGKITAKRVIGNVVKGAVAEGVLEEAPQSALQKLSQNEALRTANPNQSLSQGVANETLGGIAIGAAQGGAMAGLATRSSQDASATPAAPPAAPSAPPNPAPAAPSGPLTKATEKAATAGANEIVGDDGTVYETTTGRNGVTITPKAAAPLSNALKVAAGEAAVAPQVEAPQAPVAEAPQAPEAAPPVEAAQPEPVAEQPKTLADMTEPELRERLKYIKQQAKPANGGWNKMLVEQRKLVEREIDARTEQAKAGQLPQAQAPAQPTTLGTQVNVEAGPGFTAETMGLSKPAAQFAETKAEALAAPEAAPVTQPAPPVETTEEGAGASQPPQAAPIAEVTPKAEPAAIKPEDAGRQAFAAGKDRTPQQSLPPNGKKKWLAGWDAANLEAPVETPTKAPILQNRNRSNPSSIAQMQSIAGSPDYGRLGFSRDFANGAPVVAGGAVPAKQMGREDVAVAADGRRIPVQYAVVETADVLPSNRADGTPNADYGNQDVQRIRAIAGNGRIAGMQEAYRKGTAGQYQSELAADLLHGVSPDVIRSIREPVLVRVMPDDQVTADIGDVSNTTGNLSLSAVEQANNDAERVSLDALQFAEDGSITAEAVRQFVRAMPQAEQGGLIDTNGQPTRQAVDRINAAVFAKAYGNDELVRLYSQAQDPEARLILSALAQVAPKMARLDGAGALDIRSLVTQAAEIAVTARRKGVALARAAQQLDMAADPAVSVFLDLFAANPRNAKPIVEALGNAADFAYTEANKPAEDMFGAVPRADRADVINRLRPENERASQKDLEVAAGGQPAEVDAGRAEAQAGPRGNAAPTEEGRAGQAQELTKNGLTAEDAAKYLKDFVYSLGQLDGITDRAQIELSNPLGKSGRDTLLMKAFGLTRDQAHDINNRLDSRKPNKLRSVDMQDAFDVFPDLRKMVDDAVRKAAARDAKKNAAAEPLLTSPTREDIVARQEASEAAQREQEAADRKAAEADDKRRERDEVRRRSEAAANTFELGQDPMANLTGQKDIFSAPAEPAPAAYGSTNKLVTADRAAELRKRLKAKLSGSQLNSGIDPEILAIGAELAVFHIEAGVRKFTDFAKTIAADLDMPMEKVRPYLRSWYNGARDMMEDADVSIDGMDDPNVVRREWRQMGETNQDAPSAQENDNVPSADASVEPDRQEPASEPAMGDAVPADTRGTAGANGRAGGQAARGSRRGQPRVDGLSSGGAAADGNRGDFLVPGGNATADAASVAAGADFRERGSDIGLDGVSNDPIPAAQVDAVAEKVSDGLAKKQKQKAAEKIPVKPGDLANIKATLPYLLDGQQEDVFKAETRFAQPDGYGMLFTNGTGTGKTFTGLGTVKRMQRQGKTNILIVVPDDKIAADWIESGEPLGLKISKLKDTQDAGTGIVITSYANLGDNDALASRQWDMVVADEVHTLMQSADGTATKYLANLRAITHHPDGATQRYTMLNRADIERLKAVSEQMTANDRVISDPDTMDVMVADRRKQNDVLRKELDALRDKLDAAQKKVRAEVAEMQGAKRARLLALSATPFAYEFTVDWANGYLFDYNEGRTSDQNEFRGYNQGSNRDQFFMTHFGYSMRTNKLTKPDPSKVDTGLLQRNFNGWLRKKGSLSARMLDVSADYDRRFVLVESGIGNQIDDALNWISEKSREGNGYNGYSMLRQVIDEKFDHLSRSYLLEAIKATEVVPIVRQHMKLGRKVVVFHDYKKGGGFNPFDIPAPGKPAEDATPEQLQVFEEYKAAVMDFRSKFKSLVNAPLGQLDSPIEVFQREIPGVMLVNGDEKKKDLLNRYKEFQDDDTGPQVMLVQSAKNKGWSGHDTTGKHQRVLINLGQPTAPTLAIQQEGRIYRTGQVTDAIMRYLNTGTSWEKWTFASTIAGRAGTAENLGMGEQARALKDSFIAAFEESDAYPPGHDGEGKGGKERDKMANSAITAYDRAKTYYWATQKKNSKTKAQEGTDYYATPEPVGFKMAEWLGLRGGESSLEPSAGHGAIARWLPEITNRTVIEPSNVLRARLAMAMDAGKDRIIDGTFENHAIVNKYDGIAMNPPFGVGGKTAIEHLAKAAGHLRDGGRIVALIPTGPSADKRFNQWMYGETERQAKPLLTHPKHGPIFKGDTVYIDNYGEIKFTAASKQGQLLNIKSSTGYATAEPMERITKVEPTGQRTETYRASEGLYTVADIKLPQVTFERAGTAVATRIVVLEKQADSKRAPNARRTIDLSSITDIKELFDRIEDLSVPERTMTPEQQAADKAAQEEDQRQAKKAEAKSKPKAANPDAVGTVDRNGEPIIEHVTAKGKTLRGIVRTDLLKEEALAIDPYTLRKNGGWFIREVYLKPEGDTADEAPAMSRAELEPIFEALEGRGLTRKRALDSLANLPEAARIQYIENNFFDILGELEDSNLVDIKC